MRDFDILLRYLKKIDYPSNKFHNLINSLNYDCEHFLEDMVDSLGHHGADLFVQKTIDKLSTPEGIKIDLEKEGYPESYVYLKIKQFRIDFDESEDSILIIYSWNDGMIMHPEENELRTLKQVYQECDMQEWSDMLDMFEGAASHFFYNNCGYWLWFE